MTYDPKAIANFFLATAARDGRTLTPLQVIKLVYIAHGWHLGYTEQPLINEPPEAWKFGPVIPSLYHVLKIYGNEAVTSRLSEVISVSQTPLKFVHQEVPMPDDAIIQGFLESVWKAYGKMSGGQLSNLTHQQDTPWHKIWEQEGGKYSKGMDIPEKYIIDHYKQLITRSAAK